MTAIIHINKDQPRDAARTPGESKKALGLMALCWFLAAGVFIAVKWADTYTPPWTLVFFRMLFATLFLWQVPHFLAIAIYRREEYALAGIRTPVSERGEQAAWSRVMICTAGLVPVSLLLLPLGVAGWIYAVYYNWVFPVPYLLSNQMTGRF